MLGHFLLIAIVSDEKSAFIRVVFPLPVRWCDFLSAFEIFFFVFSFQEFDYDVSWHGFLWVYIGLAHKGP